MSLIIGVAILAVVRKNTYRVGSIDIHTLSNTKAKQWEDYKFADAIEGWQPRNRKDYPKNTKFIDYCCKNFPDTIICEYRRRTKRYYNIQVLAEIIKRRGKLFTDKTGCQSLPNNTVTVAHLRLGDIDTNPSKLRRGFHAKQIESYMGLGHRNVMAVANIERTRAIGNLHAAQIKKSLQYLQTFVNYLKSQNTSVMFRTNCLPDEDIVYMTHARNFYPSVGGFSRLLQHIQAVVLKS